MFNVFPLISVENRAKMKDFVRNTLSFGKNSVTLQEEKILFIN